jgi:hypothetical protein
MMTTREGGCLCGKVRFAVTADPKMVAVCHCRHCQKTAGSAFSIVALVPEAALTITGDPATYNDTGDSGGIVERSFCGNCGSPIVSRTAGMSERGVAAIKAAGFDDVSWLQPRVQVYCDSEQPWVAGLGALPRVAKSS